MIGKFHFHYLLGKDAVSLVWRDLMFSFIMWIDYSPIEHVSYQSINQNYILTKSAANLNPSKYPISVIYFIIHNLVDQSFSERMARTVSPAQMHSQITIICLVISPPSSRGQHRMAPNLVQMMWHSSLTALCLMDHVVGLLPVKFDRIAEGRRRCRTGTRITRPLVTALVVLCLTLLASYEWTSVLLADGIDQKYLKQWISLAVMWVLNLFVALVIYWRQLVNSGQIQSLNDSFALLASQHR